MPFQGCFGSNSDEPQMNRRFGRHSGRPTYSPHRNDAMREQHREEAEPGATSLPPERPRPGDRESDLPVLFFWGDPGRLLSRLALSIT
jgi:hypothetical protein